MSWWHDDMPPSILKWRSSVWVRTGKHTHTHTHTDYILVLSCLCGAKQSNHSGWHFNRLWFLHPLAPTAQNTEDTIQMSVWRWQSIISCTHNCVIFNITVNREDGTNGTICTQGVLTPFLVGGVDLYSLFFFSKYSLLIETSWNSLFFFFFSFFLLSSCESTLQLAL